MGKTKTKIMDDAQVEPVKKPVKKLGRRVFDSEGGARRAQTRRDELVEKLKAELEGEVAAANTSEVNQAATQRTSEVSKAEKPSEPRVKETTQKPGKSKPRSKKYQEIVKNVDKTKTYPLDEAVDMVKKVSYAKFNATLEAHINTVQTGLRGLVSLPYASGKKLRILAFGKGADQSGADIFGSDEVIENINKGLPALPVRQAGGRQGKIDFDLVITTPEWMPKLAKVARVLGPKGLMPNPKNGTITDDLKKAVQGFQQGKTEYKTEAKAPVIHLGLGKLNQPTEQLSANIKTLLQTLGKTKIKKVTLSPTMGPSVKLDLSSL